MKNLTKFVMLGLLLIPFAAVINLGNAFAQEATVIILAGSQTAGCEVEDKCWSPSALTVSEGTTVTWKNEDGAGHTVTGATDPKDAGTWGSVTTGGNKFDTAPSPFLIAPGAEWSFTFTEEGEFPYVCQVHPWMIGKVIVGEEVTPPPPPEGLRLSTDNGSVDVIVNIDKGMIHGSELMVDPPQEVTFDLAFLNAETGEPLEHVNYEFHVAEQSGAMVAHETGKHAMGSTDSQSVAFSETGSYTLMIVVKGTGASQPYDTSFSGTASSMVAVTPEFPLGIMAIMAAVVGIGIAASRFRSPFKL
ncbi:MAG: cupredoxin domain-containing protein [Nitrososphaerales archaeon]